MLYIWISSNIRKNWHCWDEVQFLFPNQQMLIIFQTERQYCLNFLTVGITQIQWHQQTTNSVVSELCHDTPQVQVMWSGTIIPETNGLSSHVWHVSNLQSCPISGEEIVYCGVCVDFPAPQLADLSDDFMISPQIWLYAFYNYQLPTEHP